MLSYHETEGTKTTLGLFMKVVYSRKEEELQPQKIEMGNAKNKSVLPSRGGK